MTEGSPQIEAHASAEIYVKVEVNERLYQGEVLGQVVEWTPAYEEANPDTVAGARPIVHALALVLSQDCDLEQDFRQRQQDMRIETDLRSVLLCPLYPADELRKQQNLSSRKWEMVRQNKDERYGYLAEIAQSSDAGGTGHPAMLLDLTRYFTVRTPELYRQVRLEEVKIRCRLETPWREHMQLRFTNYLGRIGLAREHFVPEQRRAQLPAPNSAPPQPQSS